MGLRVGDGVEVSYPVDDFPGHVGIVNELWKKAGYREKQRLVGNSKKIRKVQDGLYSFAGIEFTYGMAGYEDFTIINS